MNMCGALDRSGYSASANDQLNDVAVDSMSDHLKPLGSLRSINPLYSFKQRGSMIDTYSVQCGKGSVRMKLGFGKISVVSFEPE